MPSTPLGSSNDASRFRPRRRGPRRALAQACAAVLSLVATLLGSATAEATKFRFPLNQCSPAPEGCREKAGQVPCYVTAYIDHGGKDWNCGSMGYQGHTGSDYGLLGQNNIRPVVAAAAGTVSELNTNCDNKGFWGNACGGGLGNYVKLTHADGFVTYYGHMYPGSITVKKGDQVACGQILGKGGNSGNSTGPHLHFEVQNPIYGPDDPYGGGAGCGGPLSYWVSQGAYCRLPSTTCDGVCTPSCAGKQCGPNGCGGVCGTCATGTSCNASGLCVSAPSVDNARLGSLQVANNSHFGPGASFSQTLNVTNTGTSTWTRTANYLLAHDGGETFSAPTQIWVTTSVAPNTSAGFPAPMKAPAAPGTYTSYWRMMHDGTRFGDQIAFTVIVDQPSNYDGALFTAETFPDDTHVEAGTSFPEPKTWTFQNNGTTTWTGSGGYALVWVKDETPSGTKTGTSVFGGNPGKIALGASESVAPGGARQFSLRMNAPATAGTYSSFWQMARGTTKFGDLVWLRVIVDGPAQPDGSQFVEQSIPNLTQAKPGARFTQTFTFKNTGTNTWTSGSYVLAPVEGESFGAAPVTVGGPVAPGALAQFSVPLVAPAATGSYATGFFQMKHDGVVFGDRATMQLDVRTDAADIDGSTFQTETVPDDTHFKPGESFEKSWSLRNTGTSTWSGSGGYALVWDSEATLGGAFRTELAAAEAVAPGETKEWRLSMRAPDSPGTYRGYWRMARGGTVFGDWLWVQIIVDEPAGGASEINGNCGCAAAGGSTSFLAVGLASLLAASRRRRRL